MRIGDLEIGVMAGYARLAADMAKIEGVVASSMSKVRKSIDGVMGMFASFGVALSAAGFASFIRNAINAADEAGKMAQKMGVATNQVGGLKLAFAQNDMDAGAMVQSMVKLSKAVAGGSDAFQTMGLNVRNNDGTLKTNRQVLGEIADKFAGYEDGALKTALALDIFGKAGAEMIPLLNGGAASLDEFDAMAKKLGLTIEQDAADKADQFNDTLDLMGQAAQGVGLRLAGELLPTLSTLAGELVENATSAEFLDGVVAVLGGTFKGLYSVGVGIIQVFKTVGTSLGGVGAIIAAVLSGGSFTDIKNIMDDMKADISKSWEDAGSSISRVWEGAGNKTIETFAKITGASKAAAPEMAKAAAAGKDLRAEFEKLVDKINGKDMGVAPEFSENIRRLWVEGKRYGLTVEEITELQRKYIEQQPYMVKALKSEADARELVEKTAREYENAVMNTGASLWDNVAAIRAETANMNLSKATIAARTLALLEMARAQAVAAGVPAENLAITDAEIAGQRALMEAYQENTEAMRQNEEAKKAISQFDSLTASFDSAKLDGLFNGATKGAGEFITALQMVGEIHSRTAAAMEANQLLNGDDAVKFAEEQNRILKQSAQATLSNYAAMAGAAKGFFKENSRGYKAMEAAEKAFRAFEMAMALKNMAVQSGLITALVGAKVAGDTTMATSATTSATTEVAASMAKGQAAAVAGVANQAGGDPYSAFVRIAAMVAIMAAIGFAVGGGGGGGGAPVTNTGTGTVFGDPSAKSESLANSLETLNDNARVGLRYSAQMASSLRNIESALVGVANLVLRNGQIGQLQGTIQTGISESSMSRFTTAGRDQLMGPLGRLIGSLSTKLFGTKTTIQGSGITGPAQSYGDVMDNGFQGSYYADVTKKRRFLGITTSTSNSTILQGLDEEMARQFTQVFAGIGEAVGSAAALLGQDTEAINERLRAYIIDIGKIDLKDLSGKEISERLSAVFGAEADKIAAFIVPGLESIQRVGEGYFETLTRASLQLESVRLAFENLGTTLAGTGVEAALNADRMVEAFGGLEDFNAATDAYYSAFTSEEQQRADTLRNLARSIEGVGYDLPTTIDAWDALTMSIDTSTEAGLEAFATLIQYGPLFVDTMNAAQDALLEAAGVSASSLASTLRDGMVNGLSGEDLGKQLGDMITGGIYSAIYSGAANSIADSLIQSIVMPMLTASTTAGAIATAVTQQTIDQVVAHATAQMAAVAAIVNDAGFQQAMAGITSAISQVSGVIGATTGKGPGAIQSVQSFGNAVQSTAAAADNGAKAWQSIGDAMTSELRRIRGEIDEFSDTSAVGSFAELQRTSAAAIAGDQEAAKLLPTLTRAFVDFTQKYSSSKIAETLAVSEAAALLEFTRNSLASQYGFSVPSFDVGTDYVPDDMLAMVHKGERIVPAAYNHDSPSDSETAAEVRALRAAQEETNALLRRMAAVSTETETNIRSMSQAVVRSAGGGQPLTVKVV